MDISLTSDTLETLAERTCSDVEIIRSFTAGQLDGEHDGDEEDDEDSEGGGMSISAPILPAILVPSPPRVRPRFANRLGLLRGLFSKKSTDTDPHRSAALLNRQDSSNSVYSLAASSFANAVSVPANHPPTGRRKKHTNTFKRLRKAGILITLLSTLNYKYWAGRIHSPLTCNLFHLQCPVWPVTGQVAPGYESVKDVFLANFQGGVEVGSSFMAYVNGRPVVELYGGYHDKTFRRRYAEDSLQLVFSSSKVVEGFVMAWAVDQGWLNYDDKISTHWPEFSQGRKENVTIKELLGHRAGLTYLSRQPTFKEISDLDALAHLLAAQPHNFNGNTTQGYHAVTRGWYLNEIIRRVDPLKRTMGQIIRQEIMPKLNVEFYLGLPDELQSRVSPLVGYPTMRMLAKALFPSRLQSDPLPPNFRSIVFDRNSIPYKALSGSNPRQMRPWPHSHNRREILRSEGPSFSGVTNARSLATFALLLSNEGRLPVSSDSDIVDGKGWLRPRQCSLDESPVHFISAATLKNAMEAQEWMQDTVVRRNVTFSTGGWGVNLTLPGIDERIQWSGWGGIGGSLVLWNSEHNIAFSYVMNSVTFGGLGDRRGWRLAAELTRIATLLSSSSDSSSQAFVPARP